MGMFQKAVRHQLRGRIAIDGPSGAGKTFTALRLATALADGGKIAVINTESGAIQKYLGLAPDGIEWDFDVCELANNSPSAYTEAIIEAGKAGYAVLLIDSLSHAWEGEGGALEQVTKAQSRSNNSFTAWKDVTPQHNRMISAILKSPCHVIATMRSKTEYVLETDSRGKSVPRKVGMAPVQRSGMEYEFDLYCSMDWDHVLRVSKSRCPDMDDMVTVKPSMNIFVPFSRWLNEGTPAPEGYYTANEDDFRKLESAAIAEVNAKPMSAIERIKALNEAKATAEQAKADAQKAVAGPRVELASGQQIERMMQLFIELAVGPEQQLKAFQSTGAYDLGSLTAGGADLIIGKMEARLNGAKVADKIVEHLELKSEAEANAAQAPTPPATPESASSADDGEPCTAGQIGAIRGLIEKVSQQPGQSGIAARIKDHINKHGIYKLDQMTLLSAQRLVESLNGTGSIGDFFDVAPRLHSTGE